MDCWPRNAIWSQEMDRIIRCWRTRARPDLKSRPIFPSLYSKPHGLTVFDRAFPPLPKLLYTINLVKRYWDVIIVDGNALESLSLSLHCLVSIPRPEEKLSDGWLLQRPALWEEKHFIERAECPRCSDNHPATSQLHPRRVFV